MKKVEHYELEMRRKLHKNLHIMTGTTEATLPTSSLLCMIFLILAGGKRELYFFFFEGILIQVNNKLLNINLVV